MRNILGSIEELKIRKVPKRGIDRKKEERKRIKGEIHVREQRGQIISS